MTDHEATEPTARQQEVHDALVAAAGNMSEAGRRLGITGTSVKAIEVAYHRHLTGEAPPRKVRQPTKTELLQAIPIRLEAIEKRLDGILASEAALSVQIIDLARDIRAWTARQPLILEVRPRHQRQADGGAGGTREARAIARSLDER